MGLFYLFHILAFLYFVAPHPHNKFVVATVKIESCNGEKTYTSKITLYVRKNNFKLIPVLWGGSPYIGRLTSSLLK